MNPNQLKSFERKAYRSTFADGLWDVMLGCFVLLFALAPLLSEKLGDFWSSMIFLPFWGLVYLIIRLLRKNIVAPRLGNVTFSQERQQKIRKISHTMLLINVLVLIIGAIAAVATGGLFSRWPLIIVSGLIMLGFSLAARMLDYPRLYFYGILLFAAPLFGEWLYTNYGVAHHGFPLVFGAVSGLILLIGVVQFFRMLMNNPAMEAPFTGA